MKPFALSDENHTDNKPLPLLRQKPWPHNSITLNSRQYCKYLTKSITYSQPTHPNTSSAESAVQMRYITSITSSREFFPILTVITNQRCIQAQMTKSFILNCSTKDANQVPLLLHWSACSQTIKNGSSNFWWNRPEQAIILRPFFVATSSSPILKDSQSEETLAFSNCPKTRSVSGSWRSSQGFTSPTATICVNQGELGEAYKPWRRRNPGLRGTLLPLGSNLGSSERWNVGVSWSREASRTQESGAGKGRKETGVGRVGARRPTLSSRECGAPLLLLLPIISTQPSETRTTSATTSGDIGPRTWGLWTLPQKYSKSLICWSL